MLKINTIVMAFALIIRNDNTLMDKVLSSYAVLLNRTVFVFIVGGGPCAGVMCPDSRGCYEIS